MAVCRNAMVIHTIYADYTQVKESKTSTFLVDSDISCCTRKAMRPSERC